MAGSNETTKGGGFKVGRLFFTDGRVDISGSGAPSNGTSGTGAGLCGPGSTYTRLSNGVKYYNTNTKASPTWSAPALGGTVDVQATTSVSVGGTGVAGAAGVQTQVVKTASAMADTVATAVATVTVPNAQHTALIEVDALGVMGAGGAVGAGETSKLAKYQLVVTRTAGLAAVATLSSAIGGVQSKVAGADNITSVVVTASAMTGANSASQTFTILVAITKAAGAADNHTAVVALRVVNQKASGVTIA